MLAIDHRRELLSLEAMMSDVGWEAVLNCRCRHTPASSCSTRLDGTFG
jgi:hypothetical protein